ncbi:hypothetical protein PAPYR_4114 [Paratrimastix pyriformis]|uniref:Uncharacterized protein n=1 Tax=Paratrimastix pyriformis TaxID=342808 RepID=A0ABQ8UQA4_9EUKA|nr:hypothetical protein PAPYR_4114 [Paratrimastix pyriformis]
MSGFSNHDRIALGGVCRVWASSSHLLCNFSVSARETSDSLRSLFVRYPHLHHVDFNCTFADEETAAPLCDVLRCRDCQLDHISLPWASDVGLTRILEALAEQARAGCARPLASLDLSCVPGLKPGDMQVTGLAEYLRATSALRRLDLSHRSLYGEWDETLAALCGHPSLEELVLVSTARPRQPAACPVSLGPLFAAAPSALRKLRVGGDHELVVLTPELEANRTLEELQLDQWPEEKEQVFRLLTRNQGLRTLRFRPAYFAPKITIEDILAGLGTNGTLRQLTVAPTTSSGLRLGAMLSGMLTTNRALTRLSLMVALAERDDLALVWTAIGAHPALEWLTLKQSGGLPWDVVAGDIAAGLLAAAPSPPFPPSSQSTKGVSVTYLSFSFPNGHGGAALRQSRSLRRLNLSRAVRPTPDGGCRRLMDALLGGGTALATLTLRRVDLAQWDGGVCPQCPLVALRLGSNCLTACAFRALAGWMAGSPTLAEADLHDNGGLGAEVTKLLGLLGRSTVCRVRRLDVSGCGLTDYGLVAWVSELAAGGARRPVSWVRVGPTAGLTVAQQKTLERCARDEGVDLIIR